MLKSIEVKSMSSFTNEEKVMWGWAKITNQDIIKLYAIVNELIAEKCEEDPDVDVPIEVMLVNRRQLSHI